MVPRHGASMSTGVFHTARAGHRRRKRPGAKTLEPLDRFAELLSEHDLEMGDEGGSVTLCSGRMGIPTKVGIAMMNRIRRQLGTEQCR